MEIRYPIIILVSIIFFVIIFLFSKKKNIKGNNKKKVANTKIVKNTLEFKSIIKRYRFFLYLVYVLVFICFIAASFLSARIIEERTTSNEIYNRDILICMDVSGSMYNQNAEIIEAYKDIVKGLKGERFGLSIFNSSSLLLLPLTDDYDYIEETLDTLAISFDYNINYEKHKNEDIDVRSYYSNYIWYGTGVDSSRGSSLAGDGLASCVFDFPEIEEKRSRTIIFSTDNYVSGTELINVSEAAEIAKKRNIKIHSITPITYKNDASEMLEEATKNTGGKFFIFNQGKTVDNIVKEIDQEEKSVLKGPVKAYIIDYPTVPFVILLLSFVVMIIIEKVVLS